MLRRVAEQLFWAGRYLERAQWRARLVDVNYNLLLEVPPRDAEPWAPLLAITGEKEEFAATHAEADERSVVNFFTLDVKNSSSIRSCIAMARSNLRSIRHQLPSEVWNEINRFYLDTAGWAADRLGIDNIPAFFDSLRERFYAIIGVLHCTMPRGLAYDFIETGMMLECADNVARLVDVKYHFLLPRLEDVGGGADRRQWMAVLRSASSLEAFRQTYGDAMRVDRVIELLLFNGAVPRSARFCADRIAVCLSRIGAQRHASGSLLGEEKLADLLKATSAQVVIADGLHEFLIGFQRECAALGDRIFGAYMLAD